MSSTDGDFSHLKLSELKKLCKESGLPVSGAKNELIQRLQDMYETVNEDELLGEADDSQPASAIDEDVLNLEDDQDLGLTESPMSRPPVKKPAAPTVVPAPAARVPIVAGGKTKMSAPVVDAPPTKKAKPDPSLVQAQPTKVVPITISDKPAPTAAELESKKDARAKRFGVPITSAPADSKPAVTPSDSVASTDKLSNRAERFGLITAKPSETPAATETSMDKSDLEAKKLKRAERFGLSDSTAPVAGEALEKMKKRAERFGETISPLLTTVDLEEKKKQRIERFGIQKPVSSISPVLKETNPEVKEKLVKRAERFGLPASSVLSADEKKLSRAKRFGITS